MDPFLFVVELQLEEQRTQSWVGRGGECIWGKWGEEVNTLYEILKELTK